MFYQLRRLKKWWWVNKPEFKFWGAVLFILVFIGFPWIIGIAFYIELLFKWIF